MLSVVCALRTLARATANEFITLSGSKQFDLRETRCFCGLFILKFQHELLTGGLGLSLELVALPTVLTCTWLQAAQTCLLWRRLCIKVQVVKTITTVMIWTRGTAPSISVEMISVGLLFDPCPARSMGIVNVVAIVFMNVVAMIVWVYFCHRCISCRWRLTDLGLNDTQGVGRDVDVNSMKRIIGEEQLPNGNNRNDESASSAVRGMSTASFSNVASPATPPSGNLALDWLQQTARTSHYLGLSTLG